MSMKKEELVKHIMFLEHNNNVLNERIEIQAANCLKLLNKEWIPCSEILPECAWGYETDSVLFQLKSGSIEVGYYGTGGKYRDRYFRTYRDVFEGFDVKDVIAWQWLPKPYKENQA